MGDQEVSPNKVKNVFELIFNDSNYCLPIVQFVQQSTEFVSKLLQKRKAKLLYTRLYISV